MSALTKDWQGIFKIYFHFMSDVVPMPSDMLFESNPLPPPLLDYPQTSSVSSSDGEYFDLSTPSTPPSFHSHLDSLHGTYYLNTKTSVITISVTLLPSASPLVVDRSSLNDLSLHELVEAINCSTPKKSSDLTGDWGFQTPLPPRSTTTTTPMPKDSPKTPSVLPVHLRNANMTVSERIQAEKKFLHHDFHEQRIERELQTPSPEPSSCVSNANDEFDSSNKDGSSMKEDSTKFLTNKELVLLASTDNETQKPDTSKSFSFHSLPGAVYQDSDIESVTSRSTFSKESASNIGDTPPLVLPSNVDEAALFNNLFHIHDDAFSKFEARLHQNFGSLQIEEMSSII